MNVYETGQTATLDFTVQLDSAPITPTSILLTVTDGAGNVTTPTPSVVSQGVYTYDQVLSSAVGTWSATWTTGGNVTTSKTDTFVVIAAGSLVVSLDEVRREALNKSLTVDDGEILRMILAAQAEYTEWVGPIGTVTETLSGGANSLVLRAASVTAITAASYTDGTTIDVADLTVDNGIVYWGYNTAGWFTWGTRNVSIMYTAAAPPANHREAIIADVAGYFGATQRGPLGPDDDGYAGAFTATPRVLFPRIRALASPAVA